MTTNAWSRQRRRAPDRAVRHAACHINRSTDEAAKPACFLIKSHRCTCALSKHKWEGTGAREAPFSRRSRSFSSCSC